MRGAPRWRPDALREDAIAVIEVSARYSPAPHGDHPPQPMSPSLRIVKENERVETVRVEGQSRDAHTAPMALRPQLLLLFERIQYTEAWPIENGGHLKEILCPLSFVHDR